MTHMKRLCAEHRRPRGPREGDEKTWLDLYHRYADQVREIARHEGMAAGPAGDVVQVVFTEIVEGVRKFKRGRDGDFRTWLSKRVRGRFRDFAQGTRTSPPAVLACNPLTVPGADATDDLCAGLWNEVWREARPRLSAIQVQVMEGLLEGKTPEQLAEEAGITRNHLYQEKHRAMKRLREIAEALRHAGCRSGAS